MNQEELSNTIRNIIICDEILDEQDGVIYCDEPDTDDGEFPVEVVV